MIWRLSSLTLATLLTFAATSPLAHAGSRAEAVLPCWTLQPCVPYPDGLYFQAVGTGSSPDAAEDAARMSLAKNIRVRVEGDQTVVDNLYATTGALGTDLLRTQQFETRVRTSVEEQLEGVAISARHQDGEVHYALATIERGEASARLQAAFATLDARVAAAFERAETTQGVARARALATAIGAARERRGVGLQHAIIVGQPLTTPLPLDRLTDALQSTLAALRFRVGGTPEPVVDAAKDALARAGFTASDEASLLLQVDGATSIRPPDAFGFTRAACEATIAITDATGTQWASASYTGRSASKSEAKATAAACGLVGQTLSGDTGGDEPLGPSIGDLLRQALTPPSAP